MSKKRVTTKKGPVIGGGERTGIFLTKSDMDQLIEVIARAKARDNLAKRVGMKEFGASIGGLVPQATLGSMAIQGFVRKLAEAYGLPPGLYGVNKHGEFIKWVQVTGPIVGGK